MQIFVKLGDRTIPLTVAENEKVETLKQLIEDREGIPSSEQRLYYSTSMLRNSNTLSQSNLTNDCFVSLKMPLRGGVQIIVKNIGKGPEIGPLELTLDDTVATIKSKIEELQGIPADEVRLALRGKNLENDASLSSINQLKDKGTITLVMVQKKSPASQAARSTPSTPPVKSEPTPCANGCGFYGTSATGGYCSKCFKDLGLVADNPTPAVEQPKAEPPKPAGPVQADTSRCWECKKRVGLLGYSCKCGYVFCANHRYSDKHNCTFDYRGNQQEDLEKKLEKVVDPKVQRL